MTDKQQTERTWDELDAEGTEAVAHLARLADASTLKVGPETDEFREWIRARAAVLQFIGEFQDSGSWDRMERLLALIIDQRDREARGDGVRIEGPALDRVIAFLRGETDAAFPRTD